MRRGEVSWYDFGRSAKRRPVVVLTGTRSLAHLSTATVAVLTTTVRGVMSEVAVSETDGVPKACAINLHQVHTVEQGALTGLITQLPDAVMRRVEAALRFALAFGEHVEDA